jgi:hypothetical protein
VCTPASFSVWFNACWQSQEPALEGWSTRAGFWPCLQTMDLPEKDGHVQSLNIKHLTNQKKALSKGKIGCVQVFFKLA